MYINLDEQVEGALITPLSPTVAVKPGGGFCLRAGPTKPHFAYVERLS